MRVQGTPLAPRHYPRDSGSGGLHSLLAMSPSEHGSRQSWSTEAMGQLCLSHLHERRSWDSLHAAHCPIQQADTLRLREEAGRTGGME